MMAFFCPKKTGWFLGMLYQPLTLSIGVILQKRYIFNATFWCHIIILSWNLPINPEEWYFIFKIIKHSNVENWNSGLKTQDWPHCFRFSNSRFRFDIFNRKVVMKDDCIIFIFPSNNNIKYQNGVKRRISLILWFRVEILIKIASVLPIIRFWSKT